MLKVKKILLEVQDEKGNIMFGEFDDSKSALAEARAIKSSGCGWKLYNVSIYFTDMYELYKAVKYQVETAYGDHGCDLPEMWKMVNGKLQGYEEHADFWKEICLKEYRDAKRKGLVK